MLPFLEELREENFDILSFLPGEEEGEMNISGGTYLEKGQEIMGSMGCIYHINIFKERKDSTIDFDTFEAVLADPLVYISHIIPAGFFGFISKKTTESEEFNKDIIKTLKESFV